MVRAMESLKETLIKFESYLEYDQSLSRNTAVQYAYEMGKMLEQVAMYNTENLPILGSSVIFGSQQLLTKVSSAFFAQLTREDISRWRRRMDEHKYVPSTIVRKFSALKKLFDFLEAGEQRYPLRAEIEKFGMPRVTAPPMRPLSLEAAESVLSKPNRRSSMGKRDYAILLLLFIESLRVSEVCLLDRGDISEKHSRMVLAVTGKGRGGQKEDILLREDVHIALKDWLNRRRGEGEHIFTAAHSGQRLSVRAVQKLVTKYGQLAGVYLKPQLTRITSITLTAMQGLQDGMGEAALVKDLQLHARHRDPQTTFRYIRDVREARESSAVAHNPIGVRGIHCENIG